MQERPSNLSLVALNYMTKKKFCLKKSVHNQLCMRLSLATIQKAIKCNCLSSRAKYIQFEIGEASSTVPECENNTNRDSLASGWHRSIVWLNYHKLLNENIICLRNQQV
jgi:hypothetical protein